jgi:hypothetical protein
MQHLQKTRRDGAHLSPIALPHLPSSVHSSKFRISQVLYLPLLRKHRGCGGILPILEQFSRHSPPITRRCIQVLSFQILARSFALFCTHAKLNSFPLKRFRALCQKNTCGWRCFYRAPRASRRRRSHDHSIAPQRPTLAANGRVEKALPQRAGRHCKFPP